MAQYLPADDIKHASSKRKRGASEAAPDEARSVNTPRPAECINCFRMFISERVKQ